MTFQVNKFISHFDSHAGFAKASKFDVRVEPPYNIKQNFPNVTESLALQCESAELPGYAINTIESLIYGAPMHIAMTPGFGDISLDFICAGDLWEKKFFDYWLDYIIPKDNYNVNYKDYYQTTIEINQYSEYLDPGSNTPKSTLGETLKKTGVLAARDFLESKVTQKLGSGFFSDIARNGITGGSNVLFDKITGKDPVSPPDLKPTKIYGVKLINAFPISVDALPLTWSGSDEVHKLKVRFKYDRWLPTEYNAPSMSTPKENKSLIDKLPTFLQNPVAGEVVGQITSKLRF